MQSLIPHEKVCLLDYFNWEPKQGVCIEACLLGDETRSCHANAKSQLPAITI